MSLLIPFKTPRVSGEPSKCEATNFGWNFGWMQAIMEAAGQEVKLTVGIEIGM